MRETKVDLIASLLLFIGIMQIFIIIGLFGFNFNLANRIDKLENQLQQYQETIEEHFMWTAEDLPLKTISSKEI